MYKFVVTRNILGGLITPTLKILTIHLPIYPLIFIRQVIYSIITVVTMKPRNIISEVAAVGWRMNLRIILSATLYALAVLLIFICMQYVPISIFSILEQSLVLIIGILFGRLFLKEYISGKTALLVGISIIGLLLIVSKGDLEGFRSLNLTGILLLILYAVIQCIAGVISVEAIKNTSTHYYMFLGTTVRTSCYFVLVLFNLDSLKVFFEKITPLLWLLLVCLAFTVYLVEFLLTKSVETIGYTKTQLFTPIITVTSTFTSMLVFQEWFNHWQYIGITIVILTMYLLTKQRRTS